jgi:hypothetical protein
VGKLEQPTSSTGVPIQGFRILEDWNERSVGGVTGQNEPAAESTPCLDVLDTPSLGFHGYEITELVRGWLENPASNFGLRMEQEYDVEQTYYYVSSEAHGPYASWPYHGEENRPLLEIHALIPEPGTATLILFSLSAGGLLARRRRR